MKSWEHTCRQCGAEFDVEEDERTDGARRRRSYVAPDENALLRCSIRKKGVIDARTAGTRAMVKLGKGKNKKVELSPARSSGMAGGQPEARRKRTSLTADRRRTTLAATTRWNTERAAKIRLLEVRGELPDEVTCPETGVTFRTGNAEARFRRNRTYTCAACGTVQDVLTTIKAYGQNRADGGLRSPGHTHPSARCKRAALWRTVLRGLTMQRSPAIRRRSCGMGGAQGCRPAKILAAQHNCPMAS